MTDTKSKYAIFDWTGNRLSKWGVFDSFEDGWEFILGDMTDKLSLTEEDYQEYYVEQVEGV